jgi:hypothetical protein
VCVYICIEGMVQGLHFDDTCTMEVSRFTFFFLGMVQGMHFEDTCTMEVSLGEDAEKGGTDSQKYSIIVTFIQKSTRALTFQNLYQTPYKWV